VAAPTDKPYPGMHLRALLASRGVEITPDEAEALVVGWLHLHELACAAGAGEQGPTIYNMGPSDYGNTPK
jgi:hypothetical protein